MRALFIILLVLNVVYFAWQFIRSPSGAVVDESMLKGIEPIVLLSEEKAAKEKAAEEKAAREKEERAMIAKAKADAELKAKLEAEAIAKAEVKEKAETEAKARAEKLEREKQLADAAAAKEKIQQEAAIKAAAVSAAKKAESKVIASAVVEKKSSVVVEELKTATQAPAPGKCFTVGPYRDLEKLRGLTRAIKSYVVEADFRGMEEKLPPLYWVYTAAEKTKAQTQKTAARLRAKKITDFYIINSDRKVNSISLGRFRDKKGVQKFVKKLEKWGFDIIVELVRKDVIIYWLDYRLAAGKSIPKSVFSKYQPSNKQAASRLNRECDS